MPAEVSAFDDMDGDEEMKHEYDSDEEDLKNKNELN